MFPIILSRNARQNDWVFPVENFALSAALQSLFSTRENPLTFLRFAERTLRPKSSPFLSRAPAFRLRRGLSLDNVGQKSKHESGPVLKNPGTFS